MRDKLKIWLGTALLVVGIVYLSHFWWVSPRGSILSSGHFGTVESEVDHPTRFPVQTILPDGKSAWKMFDFGVRGGISMREFLNGMYESTFGPSVALADSRVQSSRVGPRENYSGLPHYVRVVARHPDGTVFYDQTFHNLRTNAGIDWQYNQMGGTAAAVCNYIALTNTAITPGATDTTLAGEITATLGLQRAVGTPAHTTAATTYTLTKSYTLLGTVSASVQAAAVFNASSAGTMCFENTYTQITLQPADQVTVTYSINY